MFSRNVVRAYVTDGIAFQVYFAEFLSAKVNGSAIRKQRVVLSSNASKLLFYDDQKPLRFSVWVHSNQEEK